MMKQEGGQPASPAGPRNKAGSHLSTRGLLIVFATLAVALVLGYLLLSKLIDMSQEEDCALAHRYNCGAVEVLAESNRYRSVTAYWLRCVRCVCGLCRWRW